MKIHELRPAPGSHRERTRVGRGIAAGKGKTAGRGTKGQKARAGGSIPPWFEGGQTPLHMRIPKLRGFKPRFSVEYEVVNIGAIASLVELGAFESGELGGRKASKSKSDAPITVNQDILRGVGLVRTLNKPLKVLGGGDLSTPLFVVADAFSKSAIAKIEAAGGSVSVLEVPTESQPALGVEAPAAREAKPSKGTASAEVAAEEAEAEPVTPQPADASPAESSPAESTAEEEAPKPARRGRASSKAESTDTKSEPTAEESSPADESADTEDGT
jgi:large subunit ribosomal protein L15